MTVTAFAFIKAFNFQPFMKIKNKVAVALGRRGGQSEQVYVCHQPQDRESARHRRASDLAGARRRGDRMRPSTSAYGTFEACGDVRSSVAFGGKADVARTSDSDWTLSGHQLGQLPTCDSAQSDPS